MGSVLCGRLLRWMAGMDINAGIGPTIALEKNEGC